ncbi:MAG: histidine triad protein [Candidatus Solibacter sp.]|nr:histidine triad protein [Candidatus Solibacter sp.]
MDYLWTPWRYNYITNAERVSGCVFCHAAESDDDRGNLVVHRAEHNFVILNRFPYTNGHVMVVPYGHIGLLEGMPDEGLVEMMRLARKAEGLLRAVYHPDGLNIGMNLGQSAGAGIADHVHMHVLPRWAGDTNFMTVTGETRVLPEDLPTTWEKLTKAFAGVD